jgi:hypothetical protein
MTNRWYFGRGDDITGPLSGRQLAELAAGGGVLPTDTVWKDDVEDGVPAGEVRNLFQPARSAEAAAPRPESLAPTVQPEGAVPAETVAAVAPAPTTAAEIMGPPAPPKPPARSAPKSRAVAGKGAVIVSQDGTTVRFRKRCTTCGHEDNCCSSASITPGLIRVGFFCPKCRKRRDVEIHGYRN